MGKFIKSPLNYIGGKFRLLNQILPLFPHNINTFIDLFGGGFNVGVNVPCRRVIYNDICSQVADLLKYMYSTDVDDLLFEIDGLIDWYELSRINAHGFQQMRKHYNYGDSSHMMLYALICYSFNNMIRFNRNGEFNQAFGRNRSDFNNDLRKRFVDFVNRLQQIDCKFYVYDFEKFKAYPFTDNDFVYCDPPYLMSVAQYNERGGWIKNHERKLLHFLDGLNKRKIKFALSNNLRYNNIMLEKWMRRYNVHYLKADYSNCNYQKKDRGNDSEVLITNY